MRSIILIVGVLLASLGSSAQDQPASTPFRAEANYIRVDLYPTRGGRPITDLMAEEIEILDQGVLQRIDRFEHVRVGGTGVQTAAPEAATVAEARAPAPGSPRQRLFVFFLDTYHVDSNWSVGISRILAGELNTLIQGDDLIAVMTPAMRPSDLTFARRTTGIEELLRTAWGARDRWVMLNPDEAEYANCYPDVGRFAEPGVAQEMTLRRREKLTLDALEALVEHLGTVREERKAVITITNGWRLFNDPGTLEPSTGGTPPEPPSVEPRGGRLTIGPTTGSRVTPRCDSDRRALARLRLGERFREMLDLANRTNTSFYPIDPRGFPVFDDDIVPAATAWVSQPLGLIEDRERLSARRNGLLDMAQSTDGLAIVNTRDLAAGVRRISDDLSSYYLLGFYTTQKLDGKFHRLTVRVKRPGVQVRARRGYLARAADPSTSPAVTSVTAPLAALGALVKRPLRVQTAAAWASDGAARIFVVAEAPAETGRNDWRAGGQLSATLVDAGGTTVAAEEVAIAPGATAARFEMRPSSPLGSGDYRLRIVARPANAEPVTDTSELTLRPAPLGTGTLFTRRGNTTGNRDVPTADLRFRRTERVGMDVPAASTDAGSASLLDRAGRVLSVPVTAAIRRDADGTSWRTAQLALAALAPGDYVIRLTAAGEDTLVAIRVVP